MASFTPSQDAFGFYEDGTEAASTLIGSQDTNINRTVDDADSIVLLRIRLQENGGKSGAAGDDFKVQLSKNVAAYADITTTTGFVQAYNSANLTNNGATTNRLGAGSGSFVAGRVVEDGEAENHQLTASNFTEHLFALKLIAADLEDGTTLDFRVLFNGATMTYNVTPRITIVKNSLLLYVTSSLASVHQDMSETDPGAEAFASPVAGWIVGTTVASRYSSFAAQTEQAAATFSTTAQPDGSIVTGAPGDCWRSTNTYSGTFDTGSWFAYAGIRANTSAGGTSRARYRIFTSANADGTGATQRTTAVMAAGSVTPSVSATTVSTTSQSITTFSITGEYIFIQFAWETLSAGGAADNDVNLRVGNSDGKACRLLTPPFTPDAPTITQVNLERVARGIGRGILRGARKVMVPVDCSFLPGGRIVRA